MAKKPNKGKIIQLFGQDFWERTGRYITYENNIKAVKTRYTDDDFLFDIHNPSTLDQAINEKLEHGVEWWCPYAYDGIIWHAWQCPAPWWNNDTFPTSKAATGLLKIHGVLAQVDQSENTQVEDVQWKDIVIKLRESMDTPPVGKMNPLNDMLAKSSLDIAIEALGDSEDQILWSCLLSAFIAGEHNVNKYQVASTVETAQRGMALAENSYGRQKGAKNKMESWQKEIVLFWGEQTDKDAYEILDLLCDKKLVTKGAGAKNAGKYQLGGVGHFILASSAQRRVERWKKVFNRVK